ncbi:MAG: fused MFS/spermidine synthase [Desulforhopalus sp.]
MSLSRPQDLVLPYTGYMVLPLIMTKSPRHILVIGIGSGSFIRFFQHHLPDCAIDAVDYSPHIIKIAKGYFQLPENERVNVYCSDGYHFLEENEQTRYDLILVDAFDAEGMASTIYSEQFFRLCSKHLTKEGIISCNLWSSNTTQLLEIKAILGSLLPSCIHLPVHKRGNIVTLVMSFANPWKFLSPKKKQLALLARHYNLDFQRMIKIAKQNNLTLSKRLAALWH